MHVLHCRVKVVTALAARAGEAQGMPTWLHLCCSVGLAKALAGDRGVLEWCKAALQTPRASTTAAVQVQSITAYLFA